MSAEVILTPQQLAEQFKNSADVYRHPYLGDDFAVCARFDMNPARKMVVISIDDDCPLVFQTAKLRDAVEQASGVHHLTVKDVESGKTPVGSDKDCVLISAGARINLSFSDEPGVSQIVLTQRSKYMNNDRTKGLVNSPRALQNPRGKVGNPGTVLREFDEELLILSEVDRQNNALRRSALWFHFNGQAGLSKAEKRDQLEFYQQWLQTNRPDKRFVAAETGIRVVPVEYNPATLDRVWTVVTRCRGQETERVQAFPFFEEMTSSFEYSADFRAQLDPRRRKHIEAVALEPDPSQKTVILDVRDLDTMPIAPKVVKSENDPMGGLNRALYAAQRGYVFGSQIEQEQKVRAFFAERQRATLG